jgi:hypothetical protein
MIVDRMNHPTVYNTPAKLGIIVPPTNTASEADWNRMAPVCGPYRKFRPRGRIDHRGGLGWLYAYSRAYIWCRFLGRH